MVLDLLFTKQQAFSFVEIESICRYKNESKFEIHLGTGRKHLGKGLFPQTFQKAYFFKVLQMCDPVVKG